MTPSEVSHRTSGIARAARALAWAAPAVLALLAGCAETDDLVARYGLEDTGSILLVHYDVFRNPARTLVEAPPGTVHKFRGAEAGRLLGALERLDVVTAPPEAVPAFALVFYADDEHAFKTLVLDQYLNVMPGFEYLGQTYGGFYCEGSKEFKWGLLDRIGTHRTSQAFHVALLEKTDPEKASKDSSGPR